MSTTTTQKLEDGAQVNSRQKELEELQQTIQNRTHYSLAILGMGFVRNGSGRFLNIRTTIDPTRIK
jgi:hypothetical protein